jgi:hypothetical protein
LKKTTRLLLWMQRATLGLLGWKRLWLRSFRIESNDGDLAHTATERMNLVKGFQTDYFRLNLLASTAFKNWNSTLRGEQEQLMVLGCRIYTELQTMIMTVYLMSRRSPGTSNLQEVGCGFWSAIIKFLCIKIFPFLSFRSLTAHCRTPPHLPPHSLHYTHEHTHTHIFIINSSSLLLHKTNWFLSSSCCRYHTIYSGCSSWFPW